MKIDDASSYFGSDAELTRVLGLKSQSTIGNWRRRGRTTLPELYARRAAERAAGQSRNGMFLKFDPEAYVNRS